MAETVYGAFIDYFGDLKLKVYKKEGGYTIYGCKLKSATYLNRYIFVVVPTLGLQPEETTLNSLDWVSFQTRSTEEFYRLPEIDGYIGKKASLSDVLNVLDRTKDRSIYVTSNLPVRVTLMHEPKKNNMLQYPDQCKFYQGLETYRCVVELL